MTQYMHVKSIIQVRCLTEPHTKYIYFILTLNIQKKPIKINNMPDQAVRFSQSR